MNKFIPRPQNKTTSPPGSVHVLKKTEPEILRIFTREILASQVGTSGNATVKTVWKEMRFLIHLDGCFQKKWYPQIIHFNRVFHYKPSILGYPYFWKHPSILILPRLPARYEKSPKHLQLGSPNSRPASPKTCGTGSRGHGKSPSTLLMEEILHQLIW